MKKIIILILTIILMTTLAIPAFAASDPKDWVMFSYTEEDEENIPDILKKLQQEEHHSKDVFGFEYDLDKDVIAFSAENMWNSYYIMDSEIDFFTKYTTFEEIKNAIFEKYSDTKYFSFPIYINDKIKLTAGFKAYNENTSVRPFGIGGLSEVFYREYKEKPLRVEVYEMLKTIGFDKVKNVLATHDEGAPEEYIIDTTDGVLIGFVSGFQGDIYSGEYEYTFSFYTPEEYVSYLIKLNEENAGHDGGGGPSTADPGIIVYALSVLLFGTFAIALTKKRAKA